MGRYLDVKSSDGKTFKAYQAVPASGSGPGIVLLQEIFGINQYLRDVADYYAEEGYVVLVPDLFWRIEPGIELGYTETDFQKAFDCYGKFDVEAAMGDIKATISLARSLPEVGGQKVGALGFCLGGKLAYLAATRTDIDCAVGYYGVGIESSLDEAKNIKCPLVLHIAALDKYTPPPVVDQIRAGLAGVAGSEIYVYPSADHAFNRPGPHFDKPSAMMAHSRSIAIFRKVLGPRFDLSYLWDKHCEYEFGTRNVDDTMATMVAEPYVNHIPTMTGGVGYKQLHRFYKNHFVNANPADTSLIPISRTIGADRVVDEMLFCFTHDCEIDWMLPGIPPTGKRVEIPLVAIINFRGDKLYHEHIYWDQASVLVQIGLLDPKLMPAVAGIETGKKLLDPAQPSNTLMKRWATSEPKAAE